MTDDRRLNAARHLLEVWGDPTILNDTAVNRGIVARRPGAAKVYAAAFGLPTEGSMWARNAYDDAAKVVEQNAPPQGVWTGTLDVWTGDSTRRVDVMVTRWAGHPTAADHVDIATRQQGDATWGPPAPLYPVNLADWNDRGEDQ